MLAACVFFLAPVFNTRTSSVDHARRFVFFGINNLQVTTKGLVADIKGEENRNLVRGGVAASGAKTTFIHLKEKPP
jgi:hypothetical protein